MTGEGEAPWWASDGGDAATGTRDPIAAHRAARAGRADGDPGPDHGHGHHAHDGRDAPWTALAESLVRLLGDAARGLNERSRGAGAGPPRPGTEDPRSSSDACQLCPVCAGLRVLDEVRPELVGHLSEAARHVTLAARAFVDAQAERYGTDGGFERIDLDDEV